MEKQLLELGPVLGVWGTLAIIVIYLTYSIVKDIIRNKREKIKNIAIDKSQAAIFKHLNETSKINTEILRYLKIATKQYSEEITEKQLDIIIDRIYNNTKYKVFEYAMTVKKHNKVHENEKEVKAKLRAYIENIYISDYLALSEFKFKGNELSTFLKEETKDAITEEVIKIVFKYEFYESHKVLMSYLTNFFDRAKNTLLAEIS